MTTTTTGADTGADPADLAGMFTAYGRDLLRYCTRRVGEQVAEDVVAETFLVAYEQRSRYDADRGAGAALAGRTSWSARPASPRAR